MARTKSKKRNKGMASRVTGQPSQNTHAVRNWLIGVFAIMSTSILVFAVYYWWQLQPTEVETQEQLMPIRLVEIQGELSQVSKTDVLQVLRSQSRVDESKEEGINFLTTDLDGLETSLEEIPWVLRAQVRRVWPDKLVIEITEQIAVAFWNNKHMINRMGELFTPVDLPELQLPVLTGPSAELEDMLKTFAELQQQFESAELQLHELHLSERRSWNLKLTSGIEVLVGRKELMSRVSRFIDLYPLLIGESKAPIERVDLRYDTGMAVMRIASQTRQASL